jgi:hypothetical protein
VYQLRGTSRQDRPLPPRKAHLNDAELFGLVAAWSSYRRDLLAARSAIIRPVSTASPGSVPLDLQRHCELADRVLKLVETRLPGTQLQIRDWNDTLLVEAFARAYRCLRSVRELAGRGEGDDAAVLARAIVALTLRYLWVARADGEPERRDRLRRLTLKWARDRGTLGEELDELGYVSGDEAERGRFRESVAQFRERADELEREGVRRMPDDKAIALRLDRDLRPEQPRFFELVYARIYRTTSDVAHYGIGTLLAGYPRNPDRLGEHALEHVDEERAAEALGLAIVTFAALLDFSEPVVRSGLAAEVGQMIDAVRRGESPGADGPR